MKIKQDKKAEILTALYNNSRPLGLGFLHFTPEDMDIQEARELLKESTYFDYLKGRVMKIDLSGEELDPWLYDRDNGTNACENILREHNLLEE